MTSSRTINRGVSPMTELRRYGHDEDRRLHTKQAWEVV